jgi:predicted nuclease of restriction endonuclease-like (RecB) superfamily
MAKSKKMAAPTVKKNKSTQTAPVQAGKIGKRNREYHAVLHDLTCLIEESRKKSLQIVNQAIIELYWRIGEKIVVEQEQQGWGKGVVSQLARDLRTAFPDMTGLSEANLWRMRQFYLCYHTSHALSSEDSQKLAAVLRELGDRQEVRTLLYGLSWTHHTIILGACANDLEREFYIRMTIAEKWSSRELRRQIDTDLFTRYMVNWNNEPHKVLPAKAEKGESLPFKDEYILDFLGLRGIYSELEFRKAILRNLRDFFLEFGRGLAFVGEEFPLTVGQSEFRIDLLFYHRDLRCLLAIELKIGPFKPEYVGKVQFYLAALDEQERRQHEMPSIGLVLCKSKDSEQVRLALTAAASKIGVATYKTALPDEEALKAHLRKLPMSDV